MNQQKCADLYQTRRRCHPSRHGLEHAWPYFAFDLSIVTGLVLWNALLVYLMVTRLHMNDFGKFYYSAVAFMHGQDMYGSNPATFIAVSGAHGQQFWNMNPPHFHLLLLPLALLTPGGALTLWTGVSLGCLLVSLRLIGTEVRLPLTPWTSRLTIGGLLSFAGTGALCITGQLSLLLLLPITLAWLNIRRGLWIRAGLYVGCAMSVKPFLLLFLPYMIVRRQFRALATTCTTACGCFAVGLLVFGIEAHWSWIGALTASNWAWAGMNASLLGLLTRVFADNPHFAPLTVAPGLIKPLWLLSAGLVGAVTLVAATADTSDTAADRSVALLLLGAQLIGPLGWIYYLWLPLGPLTALTTAWWSRQASSRDTTARRARQWRTGLWLGAAPGLVWPLPAVMLLQPHAMATLSLSSLYFWATLGLWLSLLVDWRSDVRRLRVTAAETKPRVNRYAAKSAGVR